MQSSLSLSLSISFEAKVRSVSRRAASWPSKWARALCKMRTGALGQGHGGLRYQCRASALQCAAGTGAPCSAASFAARVPEPGSKPGSQAARRPRSQLHCPHQHSRIWHRHGTGSLAAAAAATSSFGQKSRVMQATALNYYVERSDYESCGESEASPGGPSSVASTASSRAGTPATTSQHKHSQNQFQNQVRRARLDPFAIINHIPDVDWMMLKQILFFLVFAVEEIPLHLEGMRHCGAHTSENWAAREGQTFGVSAIVKKTRAEVHEGTCPEGAPSGQKQPAIKSSKWLAGPWLSAANNNN